ncbi:Cbb3-type cytochrome c oxidase subunit CcoP [Anaerolineales bacterium]|jgi:mono/diheme cytochrome c family protein|nr:Cbb3-type cytochrome c oxidase subunit CcoP [Anaerolineales bacterium]
MKKQDQEQYMAEYHEAKEKGVPFFPDIIFKDAVVSLLVFLVLIALAFFAGAPLERQANPADSSYIPRPEWYFLFLYQALKYFPGSLEVVGAVILPGLAILGLFALPFLDNNPKRHARNRPYAAGGAIVAGIALVGLTLLSVIESPAASDAGGLDMASNLYKTNCAGCHGQSVVTSPGTDTSEAIASGKHENGASWDANLSETQVAALAAYVDSLQGYNIYVRECGACHELGSLKLNAPLELAALLDQGPDYPDHADAGVVNWGDALPSAERNALLNFLTASQGEQLYAANCGGCHGISMASTTESDLRNVLASGDYHQDMPAFVSVQGEAEITALGQYLVNPEKSPEGQTLFKANCSECHYDVAPQVEYIKPAKEIVAEGGAAHEILPNWNETLTPEQADALVAYAADLNALGPATVGGQLFQDNCSVCHGPFGEGGANASQPGDIIAPISSSEYLRVRNNTALKQIIAYGQPNFGMSPFAQSNGGNLSDEQIDAIVAYMRRWQSNPPVDVPPMVDSGLIALGGEEVFQGICARCHGTDGKGLEGLGPSLNSREFRAGHTVESMSAAIGTGHENTIMINWQGILTASQTDDVVNYIYLWGGPEPGQPVSFKEHILPLFARTCAQCHGAKLEASGWRADSYQKVMESGKNGPNVIPGDPDNSLLVQKLLNTQSIGGQMPPARMLDERAIQWVVDWILAGAPDN